jgi:20S proteasome subunit beta 2
MTDFCGGATAPEAPATNGFSFDHTLRNSTMAANPLLGGKLPKFTKTGTTIVGLVYKDGVVLGADTRATEGPIVADKNCEKIHYMAPNIYCCGAGTAADTENVTGMIASELELLRLRTKTDSRVVSAMTLLKKHLFNYQGHVSAALVLGGCDVTGPHLYTIYPHGSTDKLPFVTMGSGSLAAMSVFEAGYKDDMDEEEAKELVKAAIRSGIFNDLGSGSNVDICVIRKKDDERQQVEMFRNVETPNEGDELRASVTRPAARDFPRGATAVISSSFEKATAAVVVADGPEPMSL